MCKGPVQILFGCGYLFGRKNQIKQGDFNGEGIGFRIWESRGKGENDFFAREDSDTWKSMQAGCLIFLFQKQMNGTLERRGCGERIA